MTAVAQRAVGSQWNNRCRTQQRRLDELPLTERKVYTPRAGRGSGESKLSSLQRVNGEDFYKPVLSGRTRTRPGPHPPISGVAEDLPTAPSKGDLGERISLNLVEPRQSPVSRLTFPGRRLL
jgi:hypothetical protein